MFSKFKTTALTRHFVTPSPQGAREKLQLFAVQLGYILS